MRWIARSFMDTGNDYSLSTEHWLAHETASQLSGGPPLKDYVYSVAATQVPPENARFVLDTGNAREGLLDVTILGDPVTGRTSSKKIAKDGDVIVSRLRPYLRQVALIPHGTCDLLGVEKLYCSTEFFVLRPIRDDLDLAGIVAWLLSDPIQEMISAAATGGHHPRISVDLILNAPVDDRFLDVGFSSSLSSVLSRHLQGQRELNVLLRH